jgi:hypothetical protein
MATIDDRDPDHFEPEPDSPHEHPDAPEADALDQAVDVDLDDSAELDDSRD